MSFKLSAAIITFNEAHRLHRALDSLIGVADEVVIVDSISTDGTLDLIKKYKDQLNIKIEQRPFAGHIEQKNFAIDLCSNKYILSLDGDEALDHNMRDEVIAFKNSNSPPMVSISKGLQTIMVFGSDIVVGILIGN